MEKKIEKLRNPYVRGNEGCSVSMIDLLEKINEVIDVLNGEQTLEEKSEIPTNLDDLLDDYFEKLVVPEHQIIFEDTYRKIATDFFNYGRNAK